jgi:hypothetical protein
LIPWQRLSLFIRIFLAGIGWVNPKVFIPGHTTESLGFFVILGIPTLVYAGLYYGVSALVAKVE